MHKSIYMKLFFVLLFISSNYYCQQFNTGYKDGWSIGYCYDSQISCIAPIPPIAPYPKIGESSSNYWDGYHRGLLDGVSKSRLDQKQKNHNNYNAIQTYGAPQYIPKLELFTPDYNFYTKSLDQLQTRYNNSTTENGGFGGLTKTELDEISKYVSSSEKEKRKNMMKFIITQYESFQYLPETIPNGVYDAQYINNTVYSSKTYGNGESNDCEIRTVLVQNNRIFWVSYKQFGKTHEEIDPTVLPNLYNSNITLSSSLIKNGVCTVQNSTFDKNKDAGYTEITEVSTKDSRYFFMDYLIRYQDAQMLLSQVITKYSSINKHEKVTDGWHVCYLTNRNDFCENVNVYVQNNKITKWITVDGLEALVDVGGEINDLKSTFTRRIPSKYDSWDETMKLFFKSTFMTKPKIVIYDAYFITI
jgi:hypothetical protein